MPFITIAASTPAVTTIGGLDPVLIAFLIGGGFTVAILAWLILKRDDDPPPQAGRR